MQNNNSFYLISLAVTIMIWLSGYSLMSALSIPVFILSLLLFTKQLTTTIPFRELAMVVASLQLLVSSFAAFYLQDPNPVFKPKGSPDAYFDFAVPGIILFGLGLFVFKPKQTNHIGLITTLKNYDLFKIGKQLIATGWIAFITLPFIPGAFAYFATLLVFLSYIGGVMMLFANIPHSKKWLWIATAFLPVVRDALFSGIFFLAMIWLTYFMLYYLFKAKKSFLYNTLVIILGLYMVIVTDTAKKEYRSITNEGAVRMSIINKTVLFTSLFIDNASFKTLTSETNVSARVTRANQGALVTWVMDYTPRIQPFGNGETIKEAIIAAIFPRFLMPNKAETGGRVLFERYTGFKLKDTSMNLSLLGEGWANFGYWGGLLFMFGVGCFYSFIFRSFSKLMETHPIYFFFIPFLFIYSIKAEDDLLTPLNHIAKASMTLVLIHHLYIRKIPFTKSTND